MESNVSPAYSTSKMEECQLKFKCRKGRRTAWDLSRYVLRNQERNKAKCLMLNCDRLLTYRPHNIKRHYRLVHKKDIPSDEEQDYETVKYEEIENDNFEEEDSSAKVNLTMTKNEFLQCCFGLVTFKGIPVSIFDDVDYFKKIIAPYEKHFDLRMDSKSILASLNDCFHQIKADIKRRLKGRMISLKFDVAMKEGKSIVLVNAQYLDSSKIETYSLGTIDLNEDDLAMHLNDEITGILNEYELNTTQIYSYITDNGSSIVDIWDSFGEPVETARIKYDENEKFQKLHHELLSVLPVTSCLSHYIHLSATAVYQSLASNLDECRTFITKLRQSVSQDECEFKIPALDSSSRWYSTYRMLYSLVEVQEYIQSILSNIELDDIDWEFVEKFVAAFKPLAVCATRLQYDQCVVGDFYRDWVSCELELKELRGNNTFASLLIDAMNTQKTDWSQNDIIVAALYLDPRFNFAGSPILTMEQKQAALNHLLKTHEAIEMIKPQTEMKMSEQTLENLAAIREAQGSSSKGTYGKLNDYIIRMVAESKPQTMNDKNLQQRLIALADGNMYSLDTNILPYWENNTAFDPQLAEIVRVILATPSTQASMQRAFSALSTITKMSAELSANKIKDLLVIKLNSSLLNTVDIAFN